MHDNERQSLSPHRKHSISFQDGFLFEYTFVNFMKTHEELEENNLNLSFLNECAKLSSNV